MTEADTPFDVLVIGAGFSGLYMLHRLRQLGIRARVLEMAENVGGTWLFNRYPGARCDIESIEYSYSFSEEIQQEWVWTESMPAQPEILAYLNYVADRLDLRRDIQFGAEVVAMTFDEDAAMWSVRTRSGDTFRVPFVVAASGILSVPLRPDIPGMDTFAGTSLFTSGWPAAGVDLTGKRVGVVGAGSTGVQLIPVVAREALHLSVFQRSPAYTLPWRVHRFQPGELDEMKARYGEIRAAQRAHPIGAARLSAFSVLLEMLGRPPLKSATREERLRAIEEHGVLGALNWGDVFFDIEANRMAAELYGEAVARIVKDPETAASLVPVHPFACKRPIIDQGYYETFNRDNVTLVDLRKSPIREVTPAGIRTEDRLHELDVIVYATGFDAMTGALSRIDIRGRGGIGLAEFWATQGPLSYLGLAVAGFPNLFTVQGPGSPSAATNFVAALEQHVEWIGDCIGYLRANHIRTIEALSTAQQEWIEHTTALVAPTVLVHPSCNSWYNGGNVPGKKRMYMGYTGGIPEYRRRCDEIAAGGYTGFKLA
ncbi:NAD(P)/FAD-dependent oxidoreductase [Mycobacterium avium subsp. hominissuis]|uniref:flavin-containing monooxygenase n=1 Tax=Mycobacterium avium TaxID=1764 RepID=UPI0004CF2239|nr:NAD(P)/FAD-dependent oxidoreductase [Mycobacterium avium]ATO62153.2 NAD(P)/FAD-dependent oxidoreductase [Mycobacterium avium subsp. hominissuis]ATO66688.1 NAD(P)/FAD-dependent oxidoreductase [Mycobacterium avium subsp. hominissuis]ATO71219.1 NAD(P)/FAD-dependent oxidoreductase [Mycobacterium avium subsp. hominissuis]PBJ43831.1 NAD(P)/FAD-dependent oxidoreductase [Mycobacterium avium subsp. hominissuis]PBJ65426.1 NAD(P)/FAD-dependent oxidoreductase [Mycobacterium avium subsp. hominissuis]